MVGDAGFSSASPNDLARPPIAWKPRAQSYHPGEVQWCGGGHTSQTLCRVGASPGATVRASLRSCNASWLELRTSRREGRHPRRRAVERAVARVEQRRERDVMGGEGEMVLQVERPTSQRATTMTYSDARQDMLCVRLG